MLTPGGLFLSTTLQSLLPVEVLVKNYKLSIEPSPSTHEFRHEVKLMEDHVPDSQVDCANQLITPLGNLDLIWRMTCKSVEKASRHSLDVPEDSSILLLNHTLHGTVTTQFSFADDLKEFEYSSSVSLQIPELWCLTRWQKLTPTNLASVGSIQLFELTISCHFNAPVMAINDVELFYDIAANERQWMICGPVRSRLSSQPTSTVQLSLIPIAAGLLPLPDVSIRAQGKSGLQHDVEVTSLSRGMQLRVYPTNPSISSITMVFN